MLKNPKNKKVIRWSLITAGIFLLIGVVIYFYYATLTHEDTASLKADYTVKAIPFIKEFEKDHKAANKKYGEKIIAVKGFVTKILPADTTMNIEMKDTTTGSYLIFAFQDQHMAEAKKIQPGDNVTLKGSCSGGIYSDILGTYFVSFKRSTIENN
jgi:hypothetical protein